jgi:hypothetical protein
MFIFLKSINNLAVKELLQWNLSKVLFKYINNLKGIKIDDIE